MEVIFSFIKNYLIPISSAVILESFFYLLYYIIKKDREMVYLYLKWLVISFFVFVSFNLGYEIGANYSFIEGLYKFIQYAPSFFSQALFGIVFYMLLHIPVLIYLYLKKEKDRYNLVMKRLFYLFGIFILVFVIVYLSK